MGLVAPVLGLCSSCPAWTDEGDPAEPSAALPEVIVTARRVAEPLQRAPVAVSAFSAEELKDRGVARLDELAQYVPNVAFFPSGIIGDSSGQAYIRGIGQFDYYFHTDPGVAIYLDGVYLGRNLGNLLDLVDIEQVEVIRGPQGSLYGKNAIGGAIHVLTPAPSEDFEAFVEVGTGSFERKNVLAGVSGSLVPGRLAGRAAFGTRTAEGYGDRPLADDALGNENGDTVFGVLDWTVSNALSLRLAADATRASTASSAHHVEAIDPAAPIAALHNALASPPLAAEHGVPMGPYDERFRSGDPFVNLGTGSNFSRREVSGVSASLTWDVRDFDVRAITARRNSDIAFGIDPDGSPEAITEEVDEHRQEQLSHEVRFEGEALDAKLTWLAGFFYFREETDSQVTFRGGEMLYPALEALPGPILPLAPGSDCPPPPGSAAPCAGGLGNPLNTLFDLVQDIRGAQTAESTAVYVHGTYSLSARLRGSYGVRATRERKDFSTSTRRLRTNDFVLEPQRAEGSWSDVSHRLGLDYLWTDNTLVYVSAAKGFKSGGFNGRARSPRELQRFAPEELWSYELGLKAEARDGRLRLNAAAFYYDYRNLQLAIQRLEAGQQVIFTENAAAAKMKGVELEFSAAPLPELNIVASVGYLDAEYTDIEPGASVSRAHALIATPKWTVAVGVERVFMLNEAKEFRLRADYRYRDRTYFDAVNTEAVAQSGYGLLDLRATFGGRSGGWSLAGGVTNATDERYRVSGVGLLDTLGFAVAYYGRPREWFLEARYTH